MRPRPIAGAIALAFLCLASLTLACFGPVLFRGRQFAYRDSGEFLLPALPARPARMAGRSAAALDAGGEQRHADAGQPHGGRPLPRQAHLRGTPLPLGRPGLRRGACRAGLLRDARPPAALVDLADGGDDRGDGLRLRRTGAVPVLQRRVPGRGGLDAPGAPLRRPMGPARRSPRPRRAGDGPCAPDTRRRPGGGLPRRHRRGGVRDRAGAISRRVDGARLASSGGSPSRSRRTPACSC